ncbi:MAG: UDP-2,3-diacylglucosamine diphosphatase [Chitinophagaceae bacterium]|nr:UDP-2,3-diacylglucosamine diphosphatase [Chitinophagaceae bacterium]
MEKRPVDVVVISDVHLGTYGCQAKKLAAYLKSITPSILILNGDIIDGWQFSKSYFPASHMSVIEEIISYITNGTRVFYITGNHDEVLRRYSGFGVGNFLLADKLVLEIDNKMTWVFHGDVFDNTTKGGAKFLAKLGSSGYGLLILINRLFNVILKSVGRERISLSKKVMEGVNKAVVKINDFETIAAELAIEKKYDYVICGHIHKPQKKLIQTCAGKVTYLNSGDWVEHCTALEYHKKEWKVFEYDENAFPQVKIEKEKPQPNVITDEINYHISSLAG